MGEYVQIGELKTWYDQDGKGDPLVLLHGGLCTNETWAPQIPEFGEHFRVLAPERQGHGHTPDVDGPLSYERMTAHSIGFLETVVSQPAHLVGWSDGGIIGLMVAISRPDLVRKLVVIGANFDTGGVPPELHEGLLSTPPDADDMGIPDAELAVVPGTSHFLSAEKPQLVNSIILSFLENDPSPTMMPVRRAGSPTS